MVQNTHSDIKWHGKLSIEWDFEVVSMERKTPTMLSVAPVEKIAKAQVVMSDDNVITTQRAVRQQSHPLKTPFTSQSECSKMHRISRSPIGEMYTQKAPSIPMSFRRYSMVSNELNE